MQKTITLIILLMAIMLPLTACGDNEAEVRQSIQSGYERFDVAYKGRDRRNVETIFAPECIFKQSDEGRTMKLPKFMNAMEFSFRAMTIYYIKSRVESLKLKDDVAEVTVDVATDALISPPGGSEGHRAKMTGKYQDTWKKTPDGWKIIQRVID
ncbi:MAG: nuclear transport factor 2 family protein [Blastocatellales bacterium]